jgi:hypothetical protein
MAHELFKGPTKVPTEFEIRWCGNGPEDENKPEWLIFVKGTERNIIGNFCSSKLEAERQLWAVTRAYHTGLVDAVKLLKESIKGEVFYSLKDLDR